MRGPCPTNTEARDESGRQCVPSTAGDTLHVQQDHNFNVTSLTDAAGAVQERYQYDPYGKATYLTANWGGRSASDWGWVWLHQGGRYNGITKLYHFRFRDYTPDLGRWMQQDPAGYVDGASLYQAVVSSPVTWADPVGLQSTWYGVGPGPNYNPRPSDVYTPHTGTVRGAVLTTASSAAGGAAAGAIGGTVTLPVIGTVGGASGGAVTGGVGGAVGYGAYTTGDWIWSNAGYWYFKVGEMIITD